LDETTLGRSAVTALAWSPDGQLVAAGMDEGLVRVWGVDGELSFEDSTEIVEIKTVQFTPNGQWLLAGWRSGGMRMWDVGNRGHVLTGNRVPGGFSQDGQHFAGGDGGGAAFCRLLVPRALRQFRGHHSGAVRLVWSRDNRHLVSLDHH